jgi:hypothetical protein
MISEAAELDLQRLVRGLREAVNERALIPEHSGSAPSAVRQERRKKRSELKQKIRQYEREIISWALMAVPVLDEEVEHE